MPIARGVLGYFPRAMAAVANVSFVGNEQHNPGQPMHWNRGVSEDHADCLVRHLTEAGTLDADGLRHTAKVAWRALALLESELEKQAVDDAYVAAKHKEAEAVVTDEQGNPLTEAQVVSILGIDETGPSNGGVSVEAVARAQVAEHDQDCTPFGNIDGLLVRKTYVKARQSDAGEQHSPQGHLDRP